MGRASGKPPDRMRSIYKVTLLGNMIRVAEEKSTGLLVATGTTGFHILHAQPADKKTGQNNNHDGRDEDEYLAWGVTGARHRHHVLVLGFGNTLQVRLSFGYDASKREPEEMDAGDIWRPPILPINLWLE